MGAPTEADLEAAATVLGEALLAGDRTLVTAESSTAGLIGHAITMIPGASRYYLGGVIAYSNLAKEAELGVAGDLLTAYGAVSAEVAEAMAVGCRTRMGTDLAISTTGLAGPEGSGDKPVGLVFAALAWNGGVKAQSWSWLSTRPEVQSRTAKMALNMARLHLLRRTVPA